MKHEFGAKRKTIAVAANDDLSGLNSLAFYEVTT